MLIHFKLQQIRHGNLELESTIWHAFMFLHAGNDASGEARCTNCFLQTHPYLKSSDADSLWFSEPYRQMTIHLN